jgi:hypothetical protein
MAQTMVYIDSPTWEQLKRYHAQIEIVKKDYPLTYKTHSGYLKLSELVVELLPYIVR